MEFKELGLDPKIGKAVADMGLTELTPIQEKAIPLLNKGLDVIALAPTGTGKTFAYALPMLSSLDLNQIKPQCLVMVPTRELAEQIVAAIESLIVIKKGISAVAIYGGASITKQTAALKENPQIIVGTPGRLIDHLERNSLKLDDIRLLILDECDEMVGMGFMPAVDKIISYIKVKHQTALFSATMDDNVEKAAKKYMDHPERVSVLLPKEDQRLIKQYYVRFEKDAKLDVLKTMLDTIEFNRAFIFCRTKHNVDKLEKSLKKSGYNIAYIHGDLKQNARERNLKAFRDAKSNILIATDIAARGIDVIDADLVINYSIPDEDEFYLHRIGRTGRASQEGAAYTFLEKDEMKMKAVFEKLTKSKMTEYIPVERKKKVIKTMDFEKIEAAVKSTVDTEDLAEFQTEIAALTAKGEGEEETKYTLEAVSAALLKLLVDAKEAAKKQKEDAKKAPKDDAQPEEDDQSTTQRFFINIGYADDLDEDSLRRFILDNVHSVKAADFTDIYLKDTFSFFELPKTASDDVLKSLIGLHFGDREVNVELSEKKKRQGGRGGFSGGFRGGHSDRGGYGHSDRGYGHSDRGGYGHSDRGGYGHSDRGGYRGGDDRRDDRRGGWGRH
ncbi:MAG: DEAD/DEAH box helicase [Bacilli bacterium]|jgi:ATP-dependent RNA helicase DeaD|nr:DEAD/DEAH box helicase [Bacilli bacterium]